MRTVLTNATLIDCVQPKAVEGAAVLIENGRIREIRTDGSTPAAVAPRRSTSAAPS